MSVSIAEAIEQLRNELREAVLERRDDDIVFAPTEIEVDLSVAWEGEAKAGGGFKVLTFVNLSAEAKAVRSTEHRVKLKLQVTDADGEPLKVASRERTKR
jgi:hypothetical protein